MNNDAMPVAIASLGLGLMSIGFNPNGNTATATPAVFDAGAEAPAIVWYGLVRTDGEGTTNQHRLVRAWRDGTVEAKGFSNGSAGCTNPAPCAGWLVVASPNEGPNAAADINFDSRVNTEDLGIMLAAWGDAPRNDDLPCDCPLDMLP